MSTDVMPPRGTAHPAGALADQASARHVVTIPARAPRFGQWPAWLDPSVREAYQRAGIHQPWTHQTLAAELAWSGEHLGLVTGTASGKSAAYGMPGLTAVLSPARGPYSRGDCVLYLAPTKALAQDQLGKLNELGLPGLRAAIYDGDTPTDQRGWARAHARWLVSNPDMLHRSLLPGHEKWRGFLRNLRFVVVDESHAYRGVFGAHVALVLRRLLRLAELHGSSPTVIATSATTADPQQRLSNLVGSPVRIVADDASSRAAMHLLFWSPQELPGQPPGTRRGAISEAADLMTDLIGSGRQTLVFARSRRAVEALAAIVRRSGIAPGRVAAYRGGYLPEERRELEASLRSGELIGLAATNALELGIDISGLDAVVMAGWPGSRASFWQQSGRAGRRGQEALVILVAREDPLDQYLIENPGAILDQPVEVGRFNVANPYVLAPHLAAAAAEAPLSDEELPRVFGPSAPELCQGLAERGMLRRRRMGWYWTHNERPTALTDLRGSGGSQVRIVEDATGKLLGTIDRPSAPSQVHEGAIYTHQGLTYVIVGLDLPNHVAMAVRAQVDYDTVSRQVTSVALGKTLDEQVWGSTRLRFCEVEVTSQVTSFLKRRWPGGEVLGEFLLDLPPSCLPTTATCLLLDQELLDAARVSAADLAGSIHAAEHAAIAMLPLIATCDRWDIGGVSLPIHPQTGCPTVVIYDGAPGGAGFAESGFHRGFDWLAATQSAIAICACEQGCPACVHSPKCGNGNNPLDKDGASRLLAAILRGAAEHTRTTGNPDRPTP